MGFPEIGDNSDDVVGLLKQIARNTGSLGDDDDDDPFSGAGVSASLGALNASNYRISETSDLDDASDAGTLTLEPGDDVALAKATTSDAGIALLAVGATDAAGVEYSIRVDGQRTVGSWTSSPLGTINAPFSFPDTFNVVVPATRSVEYRARYGTDESGSVEMAARIHTEEL